MQSVSKKQIVFGQRLGLDLEGRSVSEALAMIHDAIARDFLGLSDLGAATPKQLEDHRELRNHTVRQDRDWQVDSSRALVRPHLHAKLCKP